MATVALLANIAMIGGHFSDMVHVFVYPLIGHLRHRLRQRQLSRDPRALAGEDLERCQENLRTTLEIMEVMAEEGFGSSHECEGMGKLVSEYRNLGRETTELGGGLLGNSDRSTPPSKQCLQNIATLVDNIKLLQWKVQMFSSEKRLGKIQQMATAPSQLSGIEDEISVDSTRDQVSFPFIEAKSSLDICTSDVAKVDLSYVSSSMSTQDVVDEQKLTPASQSHPCEGDRTIAVIGDQDEKTPGSSDFKVSNWRSPRKLGQRLGDGYHGKIRR
ncbi:hypothetical protein V5O48_012305 [Marasmius crinis-equi]|uniref:Uncharacterized protein n=1 Tax=Marasmius crinis-equi TaxID=585013 RepID=A0ABR3F361_9AGAR